MNINDLKRKISTQVKFLCPHYEGKDGKIEVWLHSLIISVPYGGDWSDSRPEKLSPLKLTSGAR